jgi:hypothetical protein
VGFVTVFFAPVVRGFFGADLLGDTVFFAAGRVAAVFLAGEVFFAAVFLAGVAFFAAVFLAGVAFFAAVFFAGVAFFATVFFAGADLLTPLTLRAAALTAAAPRLTALASRVFVVPAIPEPPRCAEMPHIEVVRTGLPRCDVVPEL